MLTPDVIRALLRLCTGPDESIFTPVFLSWARQSMIDLSDADLFQAAFFHDVLIRVDDVVNISEQYIALIRHYYIWAIRSPLYHYPVQSVIVAHSSSMSFKVIMIRLYQLHCYKCSHSQWTPLRSPSPCSTPYWSPSPSRTSYLPARSCMVCWHFLDMQIM